MATAEKGCQIEKRKLDLDLPAAQNQHISIEDEMACSAISVPSLHNRTAAGDPALQSVIEENAFQALSDGPSLKRPPLALSDDGSLEDSDFLSLTFPKKLWKIVESDQFKSLWWDDDGNCVVIDEELFKKEVLERKGPLRIFETDCMKSFIRQLNLYGFSKMRQCFQRSASLVEFLAEEKAAYAFSKIIFRFSSKQHEHFIFHLMVEHVTSQKLTDFASRKSCTLDQQLQFYHNPNFKRGCPHLLVRCKRRVGIKNTPPVAFSVEQDYSENYLKSRPRSPDDQTPLGNESGENSFFAAFPKDKTHKSGHRKPTTSKGLAGIAARIRSRYATSSPIPLRASEQTSPETNGNKINQLAPFHLPQHTNHARVNTHKIDSTTTSATSLYHVIPPVPNSPFAPMMGLPGFPTMYPDLSAMQAHWASLLPFCNPWFSMPMIAAASATSMSRSSHHHRTPAYHHCPNCNCTPNTASASKGVGPKVTEYSGYHR